MLPIHLDLGFKVFYFYEGFYFLVSILVGSWLVILRLKKARLRPEIFMDNFIWILAGAILGGRVHQFL
jgi:prolipoprotein diacylglyceryltransferase